MALAIPEVNSYENARADAEGASTIVYFGGDIRGSCSIM
jgi:hypothetical protein